MSDHSFIVTPPDFIENQNLSVTLIDTTESDLNEIVDICRTSNRCYNLYYYADTMQNSEWLSAVVERSSAVIVNLGTNQNFFKKLLLEMPKTWYYGSSIYSNNKNYLNTPTEFFKK